MNCLPLASVFGAIFASVLVADDKPATTLKEALAKPTSFSFKSEPFETATHLFAKQVQASLLEKSSLTFEITILANDLKMEGFTRNQRLRDFSQRKQPVHKVLTALVQAANGNTAVKPSDSRQTIVWVAGPDPSNPKRQIILITTRQMAKQRSYKLPEAFVSKSQAP